jgi:hypothetical protein
MPDCDVNATQQCTWRYGMLVPVWLLSLVMASATLPGLDGDANWFRLGLYAGMSGIYWVRIAIARMRRERNRTYYVYIVLMILMPLLGWPLQYWLEKAFL